MISPIDNKKCAFIIIILTLSVSIEVEILPTVVAITRRIPTTSPLWGWHLTEQRQRILVWAKEKPFKS
jgi:hypothetical protein